MSKSIDPRTGTPMGRMNDRGNPLDTNRPNTVRRESDRPKGGKP